MMPRRQNRARPMLSLFIIAVVLIVAGYGLYLANMAGRLPWQEEPTRIPVTPFANLGGSNGDADEESSAGTPVSDAGWRVGTMMTIPDATVRRQSHG